MNKDPDDVLDYSFDWSKWLGSDSITGSTFTITGPDSALIKGVDTHGAKTTTVWLSGGTLGATYQVTNRVVTAGGRQHDWTVAFVIVSS